MEENMEEGQTQKGTGLHGVAPSSASVLPLPPSGFRLLPGGCQGEGAGGGSPAGQVGPPLAWPRCHDREARSWQVAGGRDERVAVGPGTVF